MNKHLQHLFPNSSFDILNIVINTVLKPYNRGITYIVTSLVARLVANIKYSKTMLLKPPVLCL